MTTNQGLTHVALSFQVYPCFEGQSRESRSSSLTQPIVEVILQVPIPQLHCLQDDICITREEVSIEVGGHRHQVKLLHTPDLQARLLPCLKEFRVLHHHGAGLQRDRAEPEQPCGSRQGDPRHEGGWVLAPGVTHLSLLLARGVEHEPFSGS